MDSLRLAMGCRACRCGSPFSPAQTRAIFFHPADPPIALQSFTRDVHFPKLTRPDPGHSFSPTDPPIALQSFTRDAPFSQASTVRLNAPSKLARAPFGARLIGLLVLPSTEVDGGVSATCGGCMALSLWSPKRWRDAMFEGPFGRSPGRTKFAETSSDRAVRFIQRWSKRRPSTFCVPFWCRVGRA
jgi:hypothetical protein